MWTWTYKPQSSWKENDPSETSFSKARWKTNRPLTPPHAPFWTEEDAWMDPSGLWKSLSNVLDQQWELIQSKKCQENIS